jgi:SAM-dependent methyltransferase
VSEVAPFAHYAAYYNLLYQDKDYAGEADYLASLIARHAPQAHTLLNLGCGTGRHDALLAQSGYRVTGVDLSEEMLKVARQQPEQGLEYYHGDAREIRLDQTFDVVTALFHVMSYQTSNEDLLAVLATAAAHLKPGGLLVFDCWYGPGVLSDPPATRIKRMRNDDVSIVRLAESAVDPNENIVTVDYEILVQNLRDSSFHRLREKHRMRYLFAPEVSLLAKLGGFEVKSYETWLDAGPPKLKTWNAVFVLSKMP